MMRSMFAGVSGLRSHQLMLDVVSNNIANVNTTGFKASRVLFADTLSQTLRNAAGGAFETTSVNPLQVGLGVSVKSTSATFTTGSLQLTDRPLDTALSGDGFYVVDVAGDQLYTRAGSFALDSKMKIVDGAGGLVQGWMFAPDGTVSTTGKLTDLTLSTYAQMPATATSTVSIKGALSAGTAVGETVETLTKVIDGLGTENQVQLRFTKTSSTDWTAEAFDSTGASLGSANLVFSASDGSLVTPTTPPSFTLTPPVSGAQTFSFTLDMGTGTNGLHQYGNSSSLALEQNGKEAGELRDFGISEMGVITGRYSNGMMKDIAQIAVAHFNNNEGLLKQGETHYRSSAVSGDAQVGVAGENATGAIKAGVLEMSNVDLAREFTDMILAQRGFQASSRVITTSDEMIQELVNLKR
ncbi:MAG: flagellar hook protein FlgE [Acidimicrobiales bacterium]|nr:flagellar hook protein FlgE [Acidimicrobiales bacterium]